MNRKGASIEVFHKALSTGGNGEGAVLAVLRQLTGVKEAQKFVQSRPTPLGSWGGWGY